MLRRPLAASLLVLGLLAACEGASSDKEAVAKGADHDGKFLVKHQDAEGSLGRIAATLRADRTLETVADHLNTTIALPEDVTIIARSCSDGTGYLPGEYEIDLCYQDLRDTQNLLKDADADDIADLSEGIVVETIYHEAGHALIDVLSLPFTGREEDVADEFAAYMMIPQGDAVADQLLSAAYEYELSADAYEAEDADEHSPDGVRAVNYQCYVYGSDPKNSKGLIDKDGLTKDRSEYCAEEWSAVKRGWKDLLTDAGALR